MGVAVEIYKSERKLILTRETGAKSIFPIGLGKNAIGHKQLEGDYKTPEGDYLVCVQNPNSKFYLSVGINYPNKSDAKAAFADGRIDKACCDTILDAHAKGALTPWYTPLGGEIFIHGELDNGNFSLGCIKMFNSDIEAIYDLLVPGTPVTILP